MRARAAVATKVDQASISRPRFVGRERELVALADALSAGQAFVLVEGEAGIGKSRLLAELWAVSHRRRHRPLVANCPPFQRPPTLGAVVDAVHAAVDGGRVPRLSDLGGALRPLFPEWHGTLPAGLDPLEDASASRHRLFRALLELMVALDITVLVVEDAHWADEATLEFLLFVAMQSDPLSVVVTVRPEDMSSGSLVHRVVSRSGARALRLLLRPLDVAESGALVSSMLADEPLSPDFAAFVHDTTDGVPVAIEESVYLMRDRAELVRRDGRWLRRHTADIAVPPMLREATLERAGRLSRPSHEALAALAVLEVASPEDTIAAVTGLSLEATRAALVECLDVGLLVESGSRRVGFRHAIPRRAIYDSIPGPRRRTLHLSAARALEKLSPQPHAQLAMHFREAGGVDRWCHHAETAADLSLQAGDERAAATLLHGLVVHADLPAPTLLRVAGKIPYANLDTDAHREVELALTPAVADNRLTRSERGAALVRLASINTFCANFEAARAHLDAALPLLTSDVPSAVQALFLMARPSDPTVPVSTHVEWLDRATSLSGGLDIAGKLRFDANRMCVLLLLGLEDGWTAGAEWPADDGEPPAQHAVRYAIVGRHLNAGNGGLLWGRYAQAEHSLATAARLAEKYDFPSPRMMIKVNQARLAWYRGDWTDLGRQVAELLADELGSAQWIELRFIAGRLSEILGDLAAAEEALRASVDRALQAHTVDMCLEPAAALARLLLSQGRVEEALVLTDDPCRAMVRKGIWIWGTDVVPAQVDALTRVDRISDAADLVEAYARGLQGSDIPAAEAGLLLGRAMLAEGQGLWTEAAERFAESAAAWQRLPRPYDALLASERQAGCLFHSGDTSGGIAVLRGAFEGFGLIGAQRDADRALRRLRDAGADVSRPRGGGRPSYGNELSPREIDVVRLLCEGRTNQAIAETLVLSVRTVGSHIRSAMRKLEVSTRTALALRAVELGYVEVADEFTVDGRRVSRQLIPPSAG